MESFSEGEPIASHTNGIKKSLAEAQKDHSVIYRKETIEVVTEEICQLVTMHLLDTETMDLEEKLKVQIDSLMAIEVRN